jgi:hypothetical protein
MAGNAALLRQRVGPRSGATMADNALDLAAVLRCPAARYNSSVFVFVCFFYTQQLEERKRMGEREKF